MSTQHSVPKLVHHTIFDGTQIHTTPKIRIEKHIPVHMPSVVSCTMKNITAQSHHQLVFLCIVHQHAQQDVLFSGPLVCLRYLLLFKTDNLNQPHQTIKWKMTCRPSSHPPLENINLVHAAFFEGQGSEGSNGADEWLCVVCPRSIDIFHTTQGICVHQIQREWLAVKMNDCHVLVWMRDEPHCLFVITFRPQVIFSKIDTSFVFNMFSSYPTVMCQDDCCIQAFIPERNILINVLKTETSINTPVISKPITKHIWSNEDDAHTSNTFITFNQSNDPRMIDRLLRYQNKVFRIHVDLDHHQFHGVRVCIKEINSNSNHNLEYIFFDQHTLPYTTPIHKTPWIVMQFQNAVIVCHVFTQRSYQVMDHAMTGYACFARERHQLFWLKTSGELCSIKITDPIQSMWTLCQGLISVKTSKK